MISKLKHKSLRSLAYFILLSLPILVFILPFVTKIHNVLGGDWDYFAQAYEAMRQSILTYRQFPWFNPWVAGGVPLYANPQFGLISLQTPFVLLFGTLVGLRLSILLYFLIGFWGMRQLLLRVGSEKLVATLLSYIWVFSSFPVWHIVGGHLTFTTYFLAPWFFYLLLNVRKSWGWLWLGLFTGFLLNQSLHYMTVHILVIGLAVAIYQLVTASKIHKLSVWELFKPYVFSVLVALPLAAHKLYFTFQYLHDFPRTPPVETAAPFNLIIAAITWRGGKIIDPNKLYKGAFGWGEYTAYFGILTLCLLAFFIIYKLQQSKKIDTKFILLVFGLITIFVLAMGNFSPLSPYTLLSKLPVFSQMQVAPRWLGWFAFGAIILLARLPKKKFIVIILALSVIDVFSSSYGVINQGSDTYTASQTKTTVLDQRGFYTNKDEFSTNSLRLFSATQANIGDVYGYEPLVGFGNELNEGYPGLTYRCASNINKSCSFVLSNNADVVYWSPNHIQLKRTAPGNIVIDTNPGSYWKVNGQRVFKPLEVIELKQDFVITDSSEDINLQVQPSFLYR